MEDTNNTKEGDKDRTHKIMDKFYAVLIGSCRMASRLLSVAISALVSAGAAAQSLKG